LPLTISVNLSARQFARPDLVQQVRQILAETGIDPRAVRLEITESVSMADSERTVTVLSELKKLGVRFSIDDFGTGFSSLSYLAKLPVDTLKIDRSFVTEMVSGPGGLTLVSVIINLARALNLNTVAEGVETEEQLHQLRLLGCDEMQGYIFGKPVPIEIFEQKYMSSSASA
jgi:EAL domain-containing protein (putative c-di-GMP-specific phosphodiesterase class I)